jgi:hypothetical protein
MTTSSSTIVIQQNKIGLWLHNMIGRYGILIGVNVHSIQSKQNKNHIMIDSILRLQCDMANCRMCKNMS